VAKNKHTTITIAGPVGSGKSTLLETFLSFLNTFGIKHEVVSEEEESSVPLSRRLKAMGDDGFTVTLRTMQTNREANALEPTTPQAFLMMRVDTRLVPQIISADTFRSTDTFHTMSSTNFWHSTLLTGHGTNYEEGLKDLRRQLDLPYNDWMAKLLPPNHPLRKEANPDA
jgi:energy-coupling factor transporter ATP-binding protein EcfA2